ncbi:MAG: DUF3175 domain-containing protein [Cyanobacteriota bacterium]|nr:DUF3175 domain-containing protein [Cyanobacteriota bacterium]
MGLKRWSQQVSTSSHALDLEPGVFGHPDPAEIAQSLWRSAEQSQRKKRSTYGSAMAMLCFYINRAGRKLSPERRSLLTQAKWELRQLREQQLRAAAPARALQVQPSTGT